MSGSCSASSVSTGRLEAVMTKMFRRALIALLLAALAIAPAAAQFGAKNKISYSNFDWQIYRSPHFDIHYYTGMEPFLEEIDLLRRERLPQDQPPTWTTSYASACRWSMYKHPRRVPGRRTSSLSEIARGRSAPSPSRSRTGWSCRSTCPPDKLYQLIAHELVHIFEYSMLLRRLPRARACARTSADVADGRAGLVPRRRRGATWTRCAIRDAVVNGVLPPIQNLNISCRSCTYRYGHAIFDFIVAGARARRGCVRFLFEYRKVLLTGNLREGDQGVVRLRHRHVQP